MKIILTLRKAFDIDMDDPDNRAMVEDLLKNANYEGESDYIAIEEAIRDGLENEGIWETIGTNWWEHITFQDFTIEVPKDLTIVHNPEDDEDGT